MHRLLAILAVLLAPGLAFGQPDWGVYPDGGTLYFYTTTLATTDVPTTLVNDAINVYKDGSATQLTVGATVDDDWDTLTGFHQIAIDTTQTGFDVGSTYTVVYSGTATVNGVSVVGKVIGSFRLANRDQFTGVRTWYVDDTDGLGDIGTFDAPFDTYAAAETAAAPGDTIYIRAGTYTTAIVVGKTNLTIEGEGRTATIISVASGRAITIASGTTLRNLKAITTDTGANGNGIYGSFATGIKIINCLAQGPYDGILLGSCQGVLLEDTEAVSDYDALNALGSDLIARNCRFTTNCANAASTTGFSCAIAGNATFENCRFTVSALVVDDQKILAVANVQGSIKLINPIIDILVDFGYTGAPVGIGVHPSATYGNFVVEGGSVTITNSGTGTPLDVETGANGRAVLVASNVNTARFSGHVRMLDFNLYPTQITTIATLASQTSFTLTAGSADNDAYNRCQIIVTDAATAVQKAVGRIADYVGSTRTVTLVANPGIFTMAVGDAVSIIADPLQGGPYQTVQVPPARTLQVKSGGDGTWGVVGRVRMPAGAGPMWWAINLAGTQLSPGDAVDSMSAPTAGGAQAANLTIADYGVQGTKAMVKLTLSGSAATTDTITLPLSITMENDEVITLTVNVTVVSGG